MCEYLTRTDQCFVEKERVIANVCRGYYKQPQLSPAIYRRIRFRSRGGGARPRSGYDLAHGH